MGRLGYLSEAQDSLRVSYNSEESYTASLYDALTHPYPPYEAIGIQDPDSPEGYRQLATSLLQIENEFYSTIRPKRVTHPGERPLHALRERGVEYVEVRAMDLDPYAPVGIAAGTMRFLDVFLLHCLLTESPPDTPREIETLNRNKQEVATRGREPGLRLERGSGRVELRAWAGEMLEECARIADAVDAVQGGNAYAEAVAAARAALANPEALPSARVLAEMRERHENSYTRFVLARSREHAAALLERALPPDSETAFIRMAQDSLAEQQRIEQTDAIPFETYRRLYLATEKLLATERRRTVRNQGWD
jgi:glutamate--cysteine ligase